MKIAVLSWSIGILLGLFTTPDPDCAMDWWNCDSAVFSTYIEMDGACIEPTLPITDPGYREQLEAYIACKEAALDWVVTERANCRVEYCMCINNYGQEDAFDFCEDYPLPPNP